MGKGATGGNDQGKSVVSQGSRFWTDPVAPAILRGSGLVNFSPVVNLLVASILGRLFDIARSRMQDAATLRGVSGPRATSTPEGRVNEPPEDIPEQDESPSTPHDEMSQYYANLEIPPGSDLDTVRRAWKRMMKRYHPDLHSGDPERVVLANELSAKLTEAYRVLEANLADGHAARVPGSDQ